VATVTPPADECWGQWGDSTALYWSFCYRLTFDVPLTATKVKIVVYVDDWGENGTMSRRQSVRACIIRARA
jgi:hypothetical protein